MTENATQKNEEQVEAKPAPRQTAEQTAGNSDEIAAMADKLAAAEADAQANLEKWQRVLADFDNYKKRVERERKDAYENAIADVMKAILPIVEDFDRAVENVPQELKDHPWVDGTVAISKKLNRLLENHDIEAIDPVGQPFDPDMHQGLGIDEDSDQDSGHVTVTLQKGYRKGNKLLRPALVRVAG